MKKAILTIGLFSMMMILTSFTSENEIGGQSSPRHPATYEVEIGGQSAPRHLNTTTDIGGQSSPRHPSGSLAIGGQSAPRHGQQTS